MHWLPARSQAELEREGPEGAEGKGNEEETELTATRRRLTEGLALGQGFIHIDTLSARGNPVRQASVNPLRGKETEALRG